jgi:dihydrofolate synthase/folylpolyglutamate synthase
MTSRTVQAILDRMQKLHPKVIDLSLGRIQRLLSALGHPERRLPPVVHVAGTNGKGSTVAMLRTVLGQAGYRVHSYISPHLVRFNERINLAGEDVADALLIDALEKVLIANCSEPITFFELTTAAAFVLFADTRADVLLLEVGLGGRLDATNVVDAPACCIITPISKDHQDYLGNTLAKIAFEKAGIIKPGVPVVSARQPLEVANVLAKVAMQQCAPLYSAGLDWDVAGQGEDFTYTDLDGVVHRYPLPALAGVHQIGNAGGVLACLDIIHDLLPVTEQAMMQGLKTVRWPGRLQPLAWPELPAGWRVWLDGGHNPQGGEVLATACASWKRPVYLIVGMGKNKDLFAYASHFAGIARRVACVPIPDHACHDPGKAAVVWQNLGIVAGAYEDIAAAVQAMLDLEPPGDIVIAGSLYLVGAVLAAHKG